MINDEKVLGIILARGGSKGVLRKNIKPLLGLPLIAYSIKAGLESRYIDKVIVSTDDEDIAKISIKYGAYVPFLRPIEISHDLASSEQAILHTLNWIDQEKMNYDVFILLQPTSPLRTSNHIDEAFEIFYNHITAKFLYSVSEVSQIPYKMKKINQFGFLEDFNTDFKNLRRRQDYPKLFYPNGAIYISKVDVFKQINGFDESVQIPYIMDSVDSIDIDNEVDFQLAESILKTRKYK